MGIIYDMMLYKASKDIKCAIIQIQRPESNRKPRTISLEHFAMHAKKIVFYQHGKKEWKLTFAYALATVVKDSHYHISQPSPYRTRITIMDGSIWFVDMYFAMSIATSDAWKTRIRLAIHEALRNKCVVSHELFLKYYPDRSPQERMPAVDWKALEKKPYWDDE